MLDENNQSKTEIEKIEPLEEAPTQEIKQEEPIEEPLPEAPVEEILPEPIPAEAPVMTAPKKSKSASPCAKEPTTGSLIAAFFFLILTIAVFTAYEIFCATYLYSPFANSPDSIEEAIAAIFGYFFGFIITFIFGLAQLPENIIAIILFKRLRGTSEKKGKNVIFTIGFALSIVMLLATLLSFALFVAIILLY